jgi:hypothetical protein
VQQSRNNLPSYIPQVCIYQLRREPFHFLTWLCFAFNDVGAYFVGKNLKNKVGNIGSAAGAASPNKTIEGRWRMRSECCSGHAGCLGSKVAVVGFDWCGTRRHTGTSGLLGDLTASMLKRDGGLKDFAIYYRYDYRDTYSMMAVSFHRVALHIAVVGHTRTRIIIRYLLSLTSQQEHGGILDRVDSFLWTALHSWWLLLLIVIPWMKIGSDDEYWVLVPLERHRTRCLIVSQLKRRTRITHQ